MLPMLNDRLGWAVETKRPIFISLVVISLILITVAGALLIRMYSISNKDVRETIAFAMTTVGAAIAIFGLLN